jgi:hypothetical protein
MPSNPRSITSTSTPQQYMTPLQDSGTLCLDVRGQVSADDEVGFQLRRLCRRGAPPAHRAAPVGLAVGPAADPARSAQRPARTRPKRRVRLSTSVRVPASLLHCKAGDNPPQLLAGCEAIKSHPPTRASDLSRPSTCTRHPSPHVSTSLTELPPPLPPTPDPPLSSPRPVCLFPSLLPRTRLLRPSSSPHTLTSSLLPTHPPLSSPHTLTFFLLPTRGGGQLGAQEAGGPEGSR